MSADSDRHRSLDARQGALFSPLVLSGQRPRWLYREDPVDESDSGWRFFEGDETDEWLNQPGHCQIAHVAHVLDRWPELVPVLANGRANSAWEWHAERGAYLEVVAWERPAD